MKSLIIGLAILSSSSVASAAYIFTHNVTGCSFWHYNFNINGYVCSNPAMSVSVPDANDVQNVINTLILKNQELEQRIKSLEVAR